MALAEGFPPAGRAEWMDEVARVLARGRTDLDEQRLSALFDRVLRTPTHDGITLDPLYTRHDAPPAGSEGLPGAAPFVRGSRAVRPGTSWDVRQVVIVTGDGASAAGRAVRELENGATSVELDLLDADAVDAALLDRVLAGVHLDAAPIGVRAGSRAVPAARALGQLCAERGVDPRAFAGSLGADPIGEHAASGGAGADLGDALTEVADLAEVVAGRNPRVRAIAVDGTRYNAAGASHVEELGAALATGVAYLRALCDAGMTPAAAAAQIGFRLSAGADQFPTIAALRAFRRLWARVGEVAGIPADGRAAHVHAVSAPAMITRYDPWVNLLRGTVACFAAGVGGADVVTVAPYDTARQTTAGDLAPRMARNTQSLLLDESGIGRVTDPAGGSFFVERLTDQMAHAAWEWFQEIERAGGIVPAIEGGVVQRRVEATWHARRRAIAHRRDPITGVSEFPDIAEPAPPAPPRAAPAPAPASTFPALARVRYAEPFESQRARADRHADATGDRPAVFLATLGAAADHTARATFAANLFAAAGIRAVDAGDLMPGDDIGAAFARSGARIACICSSDPVYAERAAEAARALTAAGAARVYLAGRPGDEEAGLRKAGVGEFAYVGCDALDLLTRALAVAGVDE